MRSVSLKLYSIRELGKTAQDRAIEDNRDINVDGRWYEFVMDNWTAVLVENGFEDVNILFSGFWSQGDGACFDATVNVEKAFDLFLPHVSQNLQHKVARHKNAFREAALQTCIRITTLTHHYNHEKTRELTIKDCRYRGKIYNTFLLEMERWLENQRLDFCKKIYADLENEYEGLRTDDAVLDAVEANEMEFLEDGRTYV